MATKLDECPCSNAKLKNRICITNRNPQSTGLRKKGCQGQMPSLMV